MPCGCNMPKLLAKLQKKVEEVEEEEEIVEKNSHGN